MHRPDRSVGWIASLCGTLLLVAAVATAVASWRHASAYWATREVLDELEREVARQRTSGRAGAPPRRGGEGLLERRAELWARLEAAAGELAQLDPGSSLDGRLAGWLAGTPPWLPETRAAIEGCRATLAVERQLVRAGRVLGPPLLAAERDTAGRLDILAASLEAASASQTESARRASRAAAAAGAAAIGLTALAAVGLAIRAGRARAEIEEASLAHEALRASEERYRTLVQHGADIMLVVEPDGTIRHASPAAQTLLGQSPDRLAGTKAWDLAHPGEIDVAQAFHADLARSPAASRSTELRWRHGDGSFRTVAVTGTNLVDNPRVGAIVLNGHDVTEQKALEQRLVYRALHDQLTGLPNRMLFMDRLEHALASSARRHRSVAVLFLDLDRFKLVNDTLGHDRGDKLLIEVAERLRTCLRQADSIARLGGDEFTVLLEGVSGTRDATVVAERIADALRRPFALDGQEVFVGVSIGIAVGSFGPDDAQGLLRNADVAMYRAKAKGRAQYEVYQASMRDSMRGRLRIEAELRRALERGELEVHYQPKVRLDSRRLVGFEALVRWQHPTRGTIAPSQFIPVAEETGLIADLDRFVLESACRQTRAWLDGRTPGLPLLVAVNLSAQHFRSPRLAEELSRVLDDSGLPPGALEVEITESTAMEHAGTTERTLERLKGVGIRLAIDDFGTGYSSLGYLRRFPIDVLKVDRSFVGGLPGNRNDAAIVQAVVAVARALGLQVVAEGVETVEQLEAIRGFGCDMGQGYLFGRPAPAAASQALIQQAVLVG